MKIAVWITTDELLSASHRAMARIMLNDGSWHPVLINGPDEATVTERAREWWAEQLAKQQRKDDLRAARAKKAPAEASVTEDVPTYDEPSATSPGYADFDVI